MMPFLAAIISATNAMTNGGGSTSGINWKDVLPSIITGGCSLLAAAAAIIGVVLSLKAHSQREKENREAQSAREEQNRAAQSERERKARVDEMRKAVLFQLTEAYSSMIQSFWLCTNVDITESELLEMRKGYGPAEAKYHLLGSLAGIKAVLQLNDKLQEVSLQMGAKRGELLRAKANHAAILQELGNISKFLDKIRGEQPRGTPIDPGLLNIQSDWQLIEAGARNNIGFATLAVSETTQQQMTEIMPLQIEALLEARAILGFADIDSAGYRAEMMANVQRMEGRMKKLHSDWRSNLEKNQRDLEEGRAKLVSGKR